MRWTVTRLANDLTHNNTDNEERVIADPPPNGDMGVSQGLLEMQEFLEAETFRSPRRGEVVEGPIVRITRDGAWIDFGAKSEGLIPLAEMHSLGPEPLQQLQVGEEVTAMVMRTDDDEITLSIDKARGERGWRVAQRHMERNEVFEATVVGYNKGGLLAEVDGVQGFIPTSHITGLRSDSADSPARTAELAGRMNEVIKVKVIEMNRRRNRLILSERMAHQEWRTQQKERLIEELREGEVRTGRVSSISPFGVFIDLGGADGLAHISELSWDRSKTPQELVKIGDEVEAYILKVDPETKRIALSLRRAQPDRWEDIVTRYQIGQLVEGTVTKLATFGAFVRIDGALEGLVHISELSDRKIVNPKEVVAEGDVLTLKIVRIEPERHRLGLSLRQALDEYSPDYESPYRKSSQDLDDEDDEP
jgi:small subunit ribosomal protein S1